MKITSLSISNVKRIKAVHIEPNGNMVVIGGMNDQGKSSVIDSVFYDLGGTKTICDRPLRDGATKGEVSATINHPKGDLIVTRTFTQKGGAVTIKNLEGMKYSSPQEILDKFTGKLTFDPVAFMRLDRKKQFEMLREMVGIDFTALDLARKELYDERSLENRRTKALEFEAKQLGDYREPVEAVDTSAIVEILQDTIETNKLHEKIQTIIDNHQEKIKERLRLISEDEQEIERLKGHILNTQSEIAELSNQVEDFEKEKPELKDTVELNSTLSQAGEVNEKARNHQEYLSKVKEMSASNAKANDLTRQIQDIDDEKALALSNAKFPVAGLNFNEDTVLFNGVPLDQASSSGQLRVSAAMAAAMNPELRIMLIRDGSLLDDNSFKLLAEFAEEHDFQIWIERVGEGDECSVIIEDGMIKDENEVAGPSVDTPELTSEPETEPEENDPWNPPNIR